MQEADADKVRRLEMTIPIRAKFLEDLQGKLPWARIEKEMRADFARGIDVQEMRRGVGHVADIGGQSAMWLMPRAHEMSMAQNDRWDAMLQRLQQEEATKDLPEEEPGGATGTRDAGFKWTEAFGDDADVNDEDTYREDTVGVYQREVQEAEFDATAYVMGGARPPSPARRKLTFDYDASVLRAKRREEIWARADVEAAKRRVRGQSPPTVRKAKYASPTPRGRRVREPTQAAVITTALTRQDAFQSGVDMDLMSERYTYAGRRGRSPYRTPPKRPLTKSIRRAGRSPTSISASPMSPRSPTISELGRRRDMSPTRTDISRIGGYTPYAVERARMRAPSLGEWSGSSRFSMRLKPSFDDILERELGVKRGDAHSRNEVQRAQLDELYRRGQRLFEDGHDIGVLLADFYNIYHQAPNIQVEEKQEEGPRVQAAQQNLPAVHRGRRARLPRELRFRAASSYIHDVSNKQVFTQRFLARAGKREQLVVSKDVRVQIRTRTVVVVARKLTSASRSAVFKIITAQFPLGGRIEKVRYSSVKLPVAVVSKLPGKVTIRH